MINLYTTEQVYEITESFFKMLNELQSEVSVNQTNVNEADKAFGDIRHFCEFNYPTERKKRTSVCKLIRDYSKQRRESKDFLSVAEPLLKEKKDLQLALGKAIPEMRKAYKVIENERHYNPRVLNDLFKEDN